MWYGLLPSDGDLRVFGRHLLEGFRAHAPRASAGRSPGWSRRLQPGARGAELLGEVFAQALAELTGPPRLLVIDDLHAASANADIVTFLDAVLRLLPSQVRVLATSRTPPRSRSSVCACAASCSRLDAERLRLSRDEMSRLLAGALARVPTDAESGRLDEASGRLAGRGTACARGAAARDPARGLDTVLADLRVPDFQLQAFFSAEVYRRLEPAARGCSNARRVLDRFDTPLAVLLTGQSATRAPAWRPLAHRGLVRSFGTGLETSYEWHGLRGAFVRQEVEESRRCGGVAGARDRWPHAGCAGVARLERAVRHALAGSDPVLARTSCCSRLSPQLLRQGRAGLLLQLLDDASPAAGGPAAVLALARADALAALGRWDEGERGYEQVLEDARRTAADGPGVPRAARPRQAVEPARRHELGAGDGRARPRGLPPRRRSSCAYGCCR